MKRLKLGVIGAGRMGRHHCRVYSAMRHVELIGVFDADRYTADQIASQYNVSRYAELDDLLSEVDAVSIATPVATHFNVAMHSLHQGVHVMVEKPIALNPLHGDALIEVARMNGLVLHVGHVERFNPAYRELRNLFGDISPYTVEIRRLSPWLGSCRDVDVIMDLMTHDIDLALDLAGEMPTAISAHGVTAHTNDIDHAVAHLQFPNGLIISLTASRLTEQQVRTIDVTAQEAFVTADLLRRGVSVYHNTVAEWAVDAQQFPRYRQEHIAEHIHVPSFEPLYLQLQFFVDCVNEGRTSPLSARAAVNAVKLAEKIRWAAKQHLIDRREPLALSVR